MSLPFFRFMAENCPTRHARLNELGRLDVFAGRAPSLRIVDVVVFRISHFFARVSSYAAASGTRPCRRQTSERDPSLREAGDQDEHAREQESNTPH
jgi:hypothetical protein